MAMRILCVHQSAELYGSDRSFLLCVRNFRACYPQAFIKVVLPARGPLSDLLTEIADEVAIERIVKLQRRDAFFLFLNKLPKEISVLTTRLDRKSGVEGKSG